MRFLCKHFLILANAEHYSTRLAGFGPSRAGEPGPFKEQTAVALRDSSPSRPESERVFPNSDAERPLETT